MEFQPEQILNNRYQLVVPIGAGGMGTVWLAEDLSGGGRVALKTLSSTVDETDRRRFEREVRTLQNLSHPHIVPFRDLGWAGDQLFFTMDHLDGVSLEELLAARGRLERPEEFAWLVRIAREVASALGHLHERRLVHRDVKPGNILLTAEGDAPEDPAAWIGRDDVTAHLADFGLVKGSDTEAHLTQSVLGTPQYMSPEQIEAPSAVDARSDLYSLGVILYRAAAGRLPFDRLSDVLAKRGMPPLAEGNPAVPPAYEDAVRRFLEFEPHRRPADAREAIELLDSVVEEGTPGEAVVAPGRRAQPVFSGRTAELATLQGAARRAARGEGRWVSLTGERGTGKTWLVTRSEFRTRALVSERLAFFSGAFTEAVPHGGFGALIEGILRHVERHHGETRVLEAVGRFGRHLPEVFPRMRTAAWLERCPTVEEEIPQEILKERVIDSVISILTSGAEVDPRILFLEDVHHSDEFDLELLRRLLLNALPLPILVVTTHRQSLESNRPALGRLLREIGVEERLEQVELGPLGRAEAATMVGSLLTPERPVGNALLDLLMERTDGVPLYLLHLFNSLWAKRFFTIEDGAWSVGPDAAELPIPESTRSHFLLMLEEIPAPERKILNLGAVIGRRFGFELLHEVAELDEFDLDEICRRLVHAGILEEHQDGFRFQHAFEREIIRERLSSPMRRRLHARVARQLERLHESDLEPRLSEIAEHMYLGGAREKALVYLRRAGDSAEASYALRQALDLFEKALEIGREDRDRRSLLVRIGDLHQRLGEPDAALRTFREAIFHFTAIEDLLIGTADALSDEDREDLRAYSDLLLKFGEVYVRSRDHDQALENFEKAERISRFIDDRAGIAFALGRQGAAHAYREDLGRAEESYRAAVEIYEDLPPSRGIVVALVGLAYVNRLRGRLERALEHSTRALAVAEELGDPLQTASLLSGFGNLYRALGKLPEAETAYRRALEISEPLGDRRGTAVALMNLGRIASLLGDYRRSLDALTRARELFQAIGDPQGEILSLGNLGTLHFYLGDLAGARIFLEEYRETAERRGFRRAIADSDLCLGVLELELDHTDAARARFEASLAGFEASGDEERVLLNRVQIARIAGRTGDPSLALEQARAARERAEEIGAGETIADGLRVEAEARRELDDLETAQELAERALELSADQGQPFAEATCLRTLAKIYRDRGFEWADRAGRHFERALATFERIGARHALAVTRREYAAFLLLVEEGETARALLAEARSVFEELGSEGELARVDRDLAALGPREGGAS